MKYCREEYELTRLESERLERRLYSFMRYAEPRKSLRLTMITPFGIKQNTHSHLVQNEITITDLLK